MTTVDAGLHEKMTWFWHGHLTSSLDTASAEQMWAQHLLLRQHALGNFKDLLNAITIDAAMLRYLNGDGSSASRPNENYSREVMELFALGRGNYTERDVRNGARALAGWDVNWETGVVSLHPERTLSFSVPFLGTNVRTNTDVINTICAHSACAPWVVTKLHRFFCGTDPSTARRTELATVFQSSNLEIRPVVENIIRHASFQTSRMNRARFPVEYIPGVMSAISQPYNNGWGLLGGVEGLDQIPFEPPNVAGWGYGTKWLSAGADMVRSSAVQWNQAASIIQGSPDVVAAALERCSLYEVTSTTRTAIQSAVNQVPTSNPWNRAWVALGLAATSPEMMLA